MLFGHTTRVILSCKMVDRPVGSKGVRESSGKLPPPSWLESFEALCSNYEGRRIEIIQTASASSWFASGVGGGYWQVVMSSIRRGGGDGGVCTFLIGSLR